MRRAFGFYLATSRVGTETDESEIDATTVLFPIAVAGGIGTTPAADFDGSILGRRALARLVGSRRIRDGFGV